MAELVLGISRTCQRAVPICQGTPPLISWRWGAWVLFTSESQGSLNGGEATFQAPSPRWTWAHHYRVNKVCLLDIVGVSGCSFWVSFSSVQSLSRVQLFVTPWTAVRQASLSITNSQSLLKLTSIESVMLSNHLSLCRPLLLLPSVFPSIRVFSNESVGHTVAKVLAFH